MNSEMVKLRIKVIGLLENRCTVPALLRTNTQMDALSTSQAGWDGGRKRPYASSFNMLNHEAIPFSHHFLIIAPHSFSLERLKAHIGERFKKMYPEEGPIHVERLRDIYSCDLDDDFLVSDIFGLEDTIYAVASRSLQSSGANLNNIAMHEPTTALPTPSATPSLLEAVRKPQDSIGNKTSKKARKVKQQIEQKTNDKIEPVVAKPDGVAVMPVADVPLSPTLQKISQKTIDKEQDKMQVLTSNLDLSKEVKAVHVKPAIPATVQSVAKESAASVPDLVSLPTQTVHTKPRPSPKKRTPKSRKTDDKEPTLITESVSISISSVDDKFAEELANTNPTPNGIHDVKLSDPVFVAPIKKDIPAVLAQEQSDSSSDEEGLTPIPRIAAFRNAQTTVKKAPVATVLLRKAEEASSGSETEDGDDATPLKKIPSLTALNEELRKSASPIPPPAIPIVSRPLKTKAMGGATPASTKRRYNRKQQTSQVVTANSGHENKA